MELLLSLKEEVPEYLWNQFKSSVQVRLRIHIFLELPGNCKSFLPVLNVCFTPKRGNVIPVQSFLCCGINFHTFVCYFAFPIFEKLR